MVAVDEPVGPALREWHLGPLCIDQPLPFACSGQAHPQPTHNVRFTIAQGSVRSHHSGRPRVGDVAFANDKQRDLTCPKERSVSVSIDIPVSPREEAFDLNVPPSPFICSECGFDLSPSFLSGGFDMGSISLLKRCFSRRDLDARQLPGRRSRAGS